MKFKVGDIVRATTNNCEFKYRDIAEVDKIGLVEAGYKTMYVSNEKLQKVWVFQEYWEIVKQIKIPKRELEIKKRKIIKEIKSNKIYSKQFKDIEKEVNDWSPEQIIGWFK